MAGTDLVERGRRLWGWWARHPRLYGAMTNAATLGRRNTEVDRAIAALGLRDGHRVLDLGCGPGANLERLVRAVGPMGTVIAIDSSPEMIEASERVVSARGWRNVELHVGDAGSYPLEEASLDGILAALSLSSIPSHARVIGRLHAALAPGHRLAVIDAEAPHQRSWRFVGALVRPFVRRATSWDDSADIAEELRATFGRVRIEHFAPGWYIAVAEKR
jgi:ubiquinone/menaquinone biosynthesis C-methylase UbiE